jgi:hypothetical protein
MGIQTVTERKRREEDLPPRSLPSNSLVNFIHFYWLIFNTIYFLFILTLWALLLFSLFLLYFVMVMAISIHLIDISLTLLFIIVYNYLHLPHCFAGIL